VGENQDPIFFRQPKLSGERGIKVANPSFPALLARPIGDEPANGWPRVGSQNLDGLPQLFIFHRSPFEFAHASP
jgi:hypothetical protein